MKPCRTCGHEVSEEAKVCPECGCPNPTAGGLELAGQGCGQIGCAMVALPILILILAWIIFAGITCVCS